MGPAGGLREKFAQAIHVVAAALLIVSVFVMTVQIVLRLFFNAPLSWPEEVVRYAFVWISYLGSTVAVTRGTHIRVLVAIDPYGPRARRFSDYLDLFCNVVCFGYLCYWGFDLAWKYKDAKFYTLTDWSQWWYYMALPIPAALSLAFLLTPGKRPAGSDAPGETRL